ncbi:MAG TPA: thioredoxin-dependent thiol peroxidase [Bacteroidia bacterium]
MTHLETGKKAPAFSVPDQNGNIRTLKEFEGKKLVLYFYPKDDTPTCTTEACNLRDNYKKLLKAGYQVVGVSPDEPKKHLKFIDKYELPFDLLSDVDNKMAIKYGVWGEKSLYGRKYMGILRTTFIINEKGKIEEIIEKVVSKDHAAQIL